MQMRSCTQEAEQPAAVNSRVKVDYGNCLGTWSYVTPPSFRNANEDHQINNVEDENDNDDDMDDDMVEYGIGDYRREFFEKILKLGQWLETHLDKWQILVFDSNFNCVSDDNLQQYLAPYSMIIPYLMCQSDKFSKYLHKIPEPFEYVRMPNIPQNRLSGDCGIYAIKHIEFHMNGLDLSGVHDDKIGLFRKKMACEIYSRDWDP
ncbi:Ulp1 protease family, C-terminal catalytic domain containing protein [Trema orientale]|uniref:Ulp1 protease family, C-terminal catalytic domain containing protein n=1 Tax=Trema orientale TaxID=63057 RepID=A0A2P5E6G7_TREOI|nr:Ulp1 protease family, C-terminal catalytic domain containing protein [Trema orientale]